MMFCGRFKAGKRAQAGRRGFTLIEIMIVVGMIAIVMSFGIPSIVETMKKGPMRQATADLLEACYEARAQAIQTGKTTELVLGTDGSINVQGGNAPFSKTLDPGIAYDLIDVNFEELRDSTVPIHVRFFPNGTCDEFTTTFRSPQGEYRKLSLDVITALANLEVVR